LGTRSQRIRNDLRRKFAAHFYRLPLGLRRGAAVLFTLSITVLMVTFYVGSYAQFKEAGGYVRTQAHRSGVIVDVYDRPRSRSTTYYVQTAEGQQRVDYPEFLPDKYLYAEVEYVDDPGDSDSVIAVGTPGDWERMSARMLWLRIGMGVLALTGIVMAWEHLAPKTPARGGRNSSRTGNTGPTCATRCQEAVRRDPTPGGDESARLTSG
jgi:hypothetical protein